jgi:NAD-dependent dihydropyrimidine dehydrogenase PreA subunit
MLNKLLRYFYGKCLEIGMNETMYLNIRNTVIYNYNNCMNLAECFNKCKVELIGYR